MLDVTYLLYLTLYIKTHAESQHVRRILRRAIFVEVQFWQMGKYPRDASARVSKNRTGSGDAQRLQSIWSAD